MRFRNVKIRLFLIGNKYLCVFAWQVTSCVTNDDGIKFHLIVDLLNEHLLKGARYHLLHKHK